MEAEASSTQDRRPGAAQRSGEERRGQYKQASEQGDEIVKVAAVMQMMKKKEEGERGSKDKRGRPIDDRSKLPPLTTTAQVDAKVG